MSQQTFNVSENVRIQIRACRERVIVNGWDNAHSAVVDGAARQDGDTLVVENSRKVNVRVPRTASVTISGCRADVRVEDISGQVELSDVQGDVVLRGLAQVLVRDLEGDFSARGIALLKGEGTWEGDFSARGIADGLEIDALEGDASLGDIGSAKIGTLDGDLAVRGLEGALHLGQVDGDVSLRNVQGDIHLDRLAGDLIASGVRGVINAPDIEGDVMISFDEVRGAFIRVEGDAVVNLPVKADADVELDAPHGDVVARGAINILEQDENHLHGTLGNGGAKVQIESLHDDVILRTGAAPGERLERNEFNAPFVDMGRDFAGMGRRIAEETRRSVEESLAASGLRAYGRHHPHHHHRHDEGETEVPETPVEKASPGLAAGTPERKAILDAIARGELNVDEAIRKIRGKE